MIIAIALSIIAVIVAFATRKEFTSGLERLQSLVTTLNETITTESAQQKAAIQNLRDEINNGADAASLNRIADELEASIGRVKGIVPDEAAPTEEAPTGDTPAEDTGTEL